MACYMIDLFVVCYTLSFCFVSWAGLFVDISHWRVGFWIHILVLEMEMRGGICVYKVRSTLCSMNQDTEYEKVLLHKFRDIS